VHPIQQAEIFGTASMMLDTLANGHPLTST